MNKTRRPRIVHVTTSLGVGGAEAVLCSLIENLGIEEFEHVVVFFRGGPNVGRLSRLGIKTFHVRGLVKSYDPVFLIRFLSLIKKLKPDCLHSLLWSANLLSSIASKLFSIPLVCAVHNNVDQDGFLRNRLARVSMPSVEKVVAVSEQVADSLVEFRYVCHRNSVNVVRNGVSPEAIGKLAKSIGVSRSTLGLGEDDFVVGAVGGLRPVKNFGLLIRAFSDLYKAYSQARLVIVGSGPMESELRGLAFDCGISAKISFITGQAAIPYYGLFDCMVQPSDKEGISIALLEAMSCEVPCVVAGINRKHMVITHGQDGLVFDVGDRESLVLAVEGLIIGGSGASKFGEEAKKTVAIKFSIGKMAYAYSELFNELACVQRQDFPT